MKFVVQRSALPLVTACEFSENPAYRNGWELWDGVLRVRELASGHSDVVAGRLVAHLSHYVRERRLGWVTMSNQGFVVGRNPDRVLAADGAFTSRTRLPRVPERGFVLCAPNFAIEVRSPTELWEKIVTRCTQWVLHGASVAWGIDPLERRVVVLRRGVEFVPDLDLARPGATIHAGPALPRFRVKVADLFLKRS